MAALIRIRVPDPQNILDAYGAGAKVRLERDTTFAMTSASEVTTIAVVAGTTEYEYQDTSGVAGTHWYWTRYSKASPSVAADYSGYGDPFQAGGLTGGCITLETVKNWSSISDTDDDTWLPLAIGAVNRAMVSAIGVDLGPSPDTTRTFDVSDTVRNGTRLWVPGGIRAFTAVEVSSDGSTWTAVTSDVRIGPAAHLRPPMEPGAYIEFKPYVSGSVGTFAGHVYIRITGSAFATFGWAAWPDDLVQCALAALQRMDLDRSRQGNYPTETVAMFYLDKRVLNAYRALYFPMVA